MRTPLTTGPGRPAPQTTEKGTGSSQHHHSLSCQGPQLTATSANRQSIGLPALSGNNPTQDIFAKANSHFHKMLTRSEYYNTLYPGQFQNLILRGQKPSEDRSFIHKQMIITQQFPALPRLEVARPFGVVCPANGSLSSLHKNNLAPASCDEALGTNRWCEIRFGP